MHGTGKQLVTETSFDLGYFCCSGKFTSHFEQFSLDQRAWPLTKMLIFTCLGYCETIVPNHLPSSPSTWSLTTPSFGIKSSRPGWPSPPLCQQPSLLKAGTSPRQKHGKPWLGFSSKQDKAEEDLNLFGAETFCSAPSTAQFQWALFLSTTTTEWIDNTSTMTKCKKSVHYGPYLTMPSLPFSFFKPTCTDVNVSAYQKYATFLWSNMEEPTDNRK